MLLAAIEPVFAQVRQGGQGGQGAGGAVGGFVCCALEFVIIAVLVVVQILFYINLSKALAQCSQRNRTMEPGMVWLNLIPFFNLVWIFITIIRVSESLASEYRSRGMQSDDPEFGKMMGILYAVFSVVGCFPVNMIFQIIYWMKVAGYKNELMSSGRGGRDDYEDDYDDRPRRRRRDEDEDRDDDEDRPRRPRRDDDD